MPESRLRRKRLFKAPEQKSSTPLPNGRWFAPVMVGLLLLGLIWVVVYYITQAKYPVPGIDNWNLIAGFAVMLVGFFMLTRWR